MFSAKDFRGSITIVSKSGISTINKKDKELIIAKINFSDEDTSKQFTSKPFIVQDKKLYYYWLSVFKKDSTGKIINGNCGFGSLFNSNIAYYKWESDSVCLIKLMSHGNLQASYKYIEHSDSSSSFEPVNDLKQ